jgi:neurofibromin 1
MYLWSMDIEAVPIAMSCFALLCEEADIRCGSDEMTVTCLLPNYHIYLELAAASSVLTTGKYQTTSTSRQLQHPKMLKAYLPCLSSCCQSR